MLKDIQPVLSQSMYSLLAEISTQEDIQVHYSRSSFENKGPTYPRRLMPSVQARGKDKTCSICKAAGRNFQGHDISSCWFLSKYDKVKIAKALQVYVTDAQSEDFPLYPPEEVQCVSSPPPVASNEPLVNKVECDVSPFFYAFYKHLPCHIVIDTGATSSIISRSFLHSAGITPQSTQHSARSADKSQLKVEGEVHLTLQFAGFDLPITALVIDNLDCDILAGIPFCKANDIQVHLKSEFISVKSARVPYGAKDDNNASCIRYAQSLVLRNDSPTVLMPGEFLEFKSNELTSFDGEVAIEP